MTRTRAARPGANTSILAVLVALAMTLAACGGAATQGPDDGTVPPTGGSDATEEPTDTGDPATSDEPGGGTGAEAFGDAATALDNLDSYAFSVEITTAASGTTQATSTRLSGIVVHSPEEASSLEQAQLDASGNATAETGIVIIGDEAWMRNGPATEPWTAVPAAQAQLFIQTMSAFRPEQIFGLYFAGIGDSFEDVGAETKNGVATTHYRGDESVGALLGGIAGVQGTWSSDVWIADDGGYVVHSEAAAEAASGGEGGSFRIVVDITDVNSAGPIEPPA